MTHLCIYNPVNLLTGAACSCTYTLTGSGSNSCICFHNVFLIFLCSCKTATSHTIPGVFLLKVGAGNSDNSAAFLEKGRLMYLSLHVPLFLFIFFYWRCLQLHSAFKPDNKSILSDHRLRCPELRVSVSAIQPTVHSSMSSTKSDKTDRYHLT